MDPLCAVLLLGIITAAAHAQAAVPVSFQGVDKNEPPPVQGTRVNANTAPEGATQTGGVSIGQAQRKGVPLSSTEIGGIPVGQFAGTQTKSQGSPTGGNRLGETGPASRAQTGSTGEAGPASRSQTGSTGEAGPASRSQTGSTGEAGSVAFTPIGMTGSGTTWAEALGYVPNPWDAPQTDPRGVLGWESATQTPPSNTPLAPPTDPTPQTGGAGGGPSVLNGLIGGDTGGLFGGIGGATTMSGGVFGGGSGGPLGAGADSLFGGMGMGRGADSLFGGMGMGGGADSLFGGMGMGGGAEGLLGGMGGPFGGRMGGAPGGLGSRSSRQADMIRSMLLLRMLGGADAPDPPPAQAGRAGMRGMRGRRMRPPSPMEQLLRFEEINRIRQQQIERAMRNRMRPENQRGNQIPHPSTPADSGAPRIQGGANRMPGRWDQPRPEAVDRQNVQMQTTSPPNARGPVPVETEPAASQGQNPRGPWDVQHFRGSDRTGVTIPEPPPLERPSAGPAGFNRRTPVPQGPRGSQNRRQPGVPRNMRELMADPRFQRRLRLRTRPSPLANSADVRADRADRMADYMDNMQAMNPIQRMMMGGASGGMMGGASAGMMGMFGMPGMPGMPGMGGDMMGMGGLLGLGNSGLTGMGALGGLRPNSQMLERYSASGMPGGGTRGVAVGGTIGGAVGGAAGETPTTAPRTV